MTPSRHRCQVVDLDRALGRYREVIPYSRYSSRGQASGTSEERQTDNAQAFALRHGLVLSEHRADRARSGTTGQNLAEGGALRSLLDDLAAGRIATPALLLIERQDRFGRLPPTTALATLFGGLLERGCDLLHIESNKLFTAESVNQNFGDLVTLAAEIHAAHQFSVQLISRTRAAHAKARERIARGEPIRAKWAPAWIGWDGTAWYLTPYAATVERLFQLFESGKGQVSVAKQLNLEGHLTPTGKAWTAGAVASVFYSCGVAGGREIKRRSGQIRWDYWPSVIHRDRWERIKAEVAARDRAAGIHGPQGQIHWFGQGQTTCTCGRIIGFRTASYRSKKAGRVLCQYVRCRGRIVDRGDSDRCTQPALRLDLVETHVLTRLRQDHWRAGLPCHQSDQLQRLRDRSIEAAAVLQAARRTAAAAETELARALRDEPAIATVMARAVAAADQEVERAEDRHLVAQRELLAAESDSRLAAAVELQTAAGQLLQRFAADQETVEDRLTLNGLLRRIGLRIVIDSSAQRIALQVGDGEPEWRPIDSSLERMVLSQGGSELEIDGQTATFTAPPEPWQSEANSGEE